MIKLCFVLYALSIMLTSCTDKVGDWEDNIELSQKEIDFSSNADSVIITTKGNGWWISNVRLNDVQINLESVNTTESVFEIVEPELIINRKNKTELQVTLFENASTDQRELIIGVQDGNYFDTIRIIQKSK